MPLTREKPLVVSPSTALRTCLSNHEPLHCRPRLAPFDEAQDRLRQAQGERTFSVSSAVKGADGLRELRPRAGRSPWRAFYRYVGDVMVIGACGPEAGADPRAFQAAVQRATDRLAEYKARER